MFPSLTPPSRLVRLLRCLPMLVLLFVATESNGQQLEDQPDKPSASETSGAATPQPLPPLKRLGQTSLPDVENDGELLRIHSTWEKIQKEHDGEDVFAGSLAHMPPHVRDHWRNIIKQMPGMPPDKKLRVINGFFNRMPSRNDLENYGHEEYWALPKEFLQKGGDCEDFAIIKYMALRHFGWPAQDLWIALVETKADSKGHAVLIARMDKRVFVLDNLSRPPHLLIPEDQYASGYIPLYVFNEEGIWMFKRAKERRKTNVIRFQIPRLSD